jgi:hypothetical protein
MSQVSIIGPTATNVIVKLDKVSQLSSEYRFSNEFTFSNMIWKVAVKEARSYLSFLIYSTNKTLHRNRGFKIMVKIPAKKENNHIFVEARRHFGNKSTCFSWTCEKTAVWQNCMSGETLVIDVAIQIMADDKILTAVPDADPSDPAGSHSLYQTLGTLAGIGTDTFTWKADRLSLVGQEGKYSPEYSYNNQVWETSICKSGAIYAIKINCNREKRSSLNQWKWKVFARIQVIIRSTSGANVQPIEVEGARSFSSPDDSMCWSFDKNVNSLIHDDCLMIDTKITVYSFEGQENGHVNGNGVSVKHDESVNYGTSGGPSLSLANSPFAADICFSVQGNKQVWVHRGVLMAASNYFRETMNKDNYVSEIRLPDMKESECMALVRYMYTNEVKVDDEDLLLTIKAAEKFQMHEFVARCRPVITVHNVLRFLDPSKKGNNPILQECWQVIDDHFDEVAKTTDFGTITVPVLQAILKRDSLRCREILIYSHVLAWSTAQLAAKNLPVTQENQKEVLKDILPLIRFPIMTGAEFTGGPVAHGLLDQGDIINCFMYQTTQTKPPTLKFSIDPRAE